MKKQLITLAALAGGFVIGASALVALADWSPAPPNPPSNNVCGAIFQCQPFSLIRPVSGIGTDVNWLVDKFQTSDGFSSIRIIVNFSSSLSKSISISANEVRPSFKLSKSM